MPLKHPVSVLAQTSNLSIKNAPVQLLGQGHAFWVRRWWEFVPDAFELTSVGSLEFSVEDFAVCLGSQGTP